MDKIRLFCAGKLDKLNKSKNNARAFNYYLPDAHAGIPHLFSMHKRGKKQGGY